MMNSKNLLAIGILCAFVTMQYSLKARDLGTASVQTLQELYEDLYENASTVSHLEKAPDMDSIVKLTNGSKYAVVIWDAHTEKNKATFNALLSVSIPSDHQKLIFFGEKISFSNKVGIAGKIKLKLVQDITIMKGEVISLTFKAKDTYAEIDCNGFDKMNVGVDLEFSRDYILRETAGGNVSKERLKTSFEIQMKDFSDFLLNINLPAFQIKGLKDISFTATQVYFDFSDYANPPKLSLNADHDSIFARETTAKLWQGVYLGKVSIKLPRFIKNDKKAERLEIGANNMVIDEHGFTGAIQAGGLVGIDKGSLGSWSFSLDALGIILKKSQLDQGFFEGKIKIPIGKEKDIMEYKCSIGLDGTYAFKVDVKSAMAFPVFKADTVRLLPNSSLSITVAEDTVRLRAILNGSMSISAPFSDEDSDDRLTVGNLGFEGLEVANYYPELSLKALSYTSTDANKTPQLARFPLQITKLRLHSEAKKIMLEVDVNLNLNSKFGAGGGLTIYGRISEENERIKYEYDRVALNSFHIDVEVTKFSLKGDINFFERSREFGNGFKGNIKMVLALTKDRPLKLDVGSIFGKVKNHRYWFVDASISGLSIPVFSGVEINGFAGGAYYGMRKDDQARNPLSKTLSGQKYVPDSTAGMGFQAGVTIAVPKPKTFTGKLLLELAFSKSGGLNSILLLGEGECMPSNGIVTDLNSMVEKINKLPTSSQKNTSSKGLSNDIPILEHFESMDQDAISNTFGGGTKKNKDILKMTLKIELNFLKEELVANFKPYVSIAGGLLKGAYENGLAGEGNLYFGPEKWFVNMGKPSLPIKLLAYGMADFSCYFMIGKEIEGSPAPPAAIAQILNINPSRLDATRDLNAIKGGGGICFGASLQAETGEKQFAIFYYRITAGIGFDVMLKDYGENAYCEGRSGNLGVNGWYASGQAYAYYQGTVGIQVNLAFTRGRFEIFSVGAAALLQAKLPNPTWMSGTVGGNYNILNGLVKGHCHLGVEIGENCIAKKTGGELGNINVISQLTPDDKTQDISVFVKPQAVFNIPIDEVFSLEDPMYPGKTKRYRAVLKTFKVTLKKGDPVLGDLEWNTDHTTVAFKSPKILDPKQEFEVLVKVGFEHEVDGTWQTFKNEKDQVEQETRQIQFKTGAAPKDIPQENLEFTYPAIAQKNYHIDIIRTGYIQLIQDQRYLFEDPKFSPSVFIKDSKGKKTEIPVSYNAAKMNIVYTMPLLAKNEIYTLSLENMPKDRNAALDKNVSLQSKEVLTANVDNSSTAIVNTKTATGTVEEIKGKVLLKYSFRTSHYETIAKKMAAQHLESSYFRDISGSSLALSAKVRQTLENFDAAELGSNRSNLISFEINFRNHVWFTTLLKSQIYQNYPLLGILSFKRDTALMGLIPTKDITFTQISAIENLTKAEIDDGKIQFSDGSYKITGNFHHTLYEDYKHITALLADMHSKNISIGNHLKLLESNFPGLSRSQNFIYPLEIFYHLPWEKQKRKVYTLNIVLD